jgi:hypothetical protein
VNRDESGHVQNYRGLAPISVSRGLVEAKTGWVGAKSGSIGAQSGSIGARSGLSQDFFFQTSPRLIQT